MNLFILSSYKWKNLSVFHELWMVLVLRHEKSFAVDQSSSWILRWSHLFFAKFSNENWLLRNVFLEFFACGHNRRSSVGIDKCRLLLRRLFALHLRQVVDFVQTLVSNDSLSIERLLEKWVFKSGVCTFDFYYWQLRLILPSLHRRL